MRAALATFGITLALLGVGIGQAHQVSAPTTAGPHVVSAAKFRTAVDGWRKAKAEARALGREVKALRALTTLEPSSNRELGRHLADLVYGWTGTEFAALDALWGGRESGWRADAYNGSSGACHIPQALPCSKIPGGLSASPATAIRWGLAYIHDRYGRPSAALAHSHRLGWY